ncbi:hypothetical protein M408DRAFT_333888 [Serendipita vermifera MAFF 305830]|uniref:Uncharacterized protein n=1 Tax=Serendipita vermifera MAFF 305830 TaxID=933852 RepID=A0A0C3AKU3_SERVB|nr:hypothetical protein M408DRAFT_333888 [Serendipita vermifera MAFF 305830]
MTQSVSSTTSRYTQKNVTIVVVREGNTPSRSGTVTPARARPTTAKPTADNTPSGSTTINTGCTAGVVNTVTVKMSHQFIASAEDLWGWSRTRIEFRCGFGLLHSRHHSWWSIFIVLWNNDRSLPLVGTSKKTVRRWRLWEGPIKWKVRHLLPLSSKYPHPYTTAPCLLLSTKALAL